MENHVAFILAAVTLTSATSIVPRLSPPALTAAIKRSPTLPALIELHALQRHNFNHIHISAFWARAGALGSAKSAQALQPAVEDTLRLCTTAEFGCRQITGTVHGLAKSGFGREPECQPLWNALSESALGQLRDYGPREIATTAWSYARCGLGQGYPRLFATLALEARGRLGEYTPQGLANLAWAMAKAQHAALALFAELEAELQRPHLERRRENQGRGRGRRGRRGHGRPHPGGAAGAGLLCQGHWRGGRGGARGLAPAGRV
jgi:hypothetical protein